jgi:hypothetical protein
MPKIAVIFKPYRSWITQIFQNSWFYELTKKNLLSTKFSIKNIIITSVTSEEIFELYKYLCTHYDDSYKFVISVSLTQLFWDEELKELEKNNLLFNNK